MRLKNSDKQLLKQKLGTDWEQILELAPAVVKALILVFQRVRFTDQEAEIIFKKRFLIANAVDKEEILEILKTTED